MKTKPHSLLSSLANHLPQRREQIYPIQREPDPNKPFEKIKNLEGVEYLTLKSDLSYLHDAEVEVLEVFFERKNIRFSIMIGGFQEVSFPISDYDG